MPAVKVYCFVLACFFVCAWPLHAAFRSDPDYLIETWDIQQGMPDNSATAMVQTPDGYLWIGTFNGLVQFDGVKFRVFDSSNVPELPSSGIVNLHLDGSGRLWVSTLKGLVAHESGRWTPYPREQGWTGDYARSFAERKGVICITSFDGHVFCVQSNLVTDLPEPPGEKGHGYFGQVDHNGRIWAAQDHFFGFWSGQRWVTSPLAQTITNGFVAADQARDGNLLVLSGQTLLRLDGDQIVSSTTLSETIPEVWRMDEDRRGQLWISTMDNGLFRLSPGGALRHYTSTNGLTCDPLRCAFEDREHNIWVGTSGGGLQRFRPRSFAAYDLETGLPERNIRAVVEQAPGKILIGTYGKGVVSLESNRVSRLAQDAPVVPTYVQTLLVDHQGNTWIGTFGRGLFVLSGQTLRRVSTAESGGNKVTALFEDSRGRIWIGGNQTLSMFADGQFTSYPTNGPISLANIRYLAQSPTDRTIWAGSTEGLFQQQNSGWVEVQPPERDSAGDITCLHFDTNGTLWMGEAETGITRLRSGRWSMVSEAQGLPARGISCLLDDGLGYWWMGSRRGVIRTSRRELERVADRTQAKLTCQVFDESDGLPGAESPQGFQTTGLKDSQGRLWFATLRGVAMVDPAAILINTNPPPVYVEALRLEDFSNGQQTISWFDGAFPVIVPPNTREITVRFSSPSFAAPEKMKFAYRIEGVDGEWKDLENRRAIYFYPPAPGSYSVRVKAANNDGIWNETGVALAFKVQPLIWQTAWFRFLVLAGLSSVTGIIVWRLGRTRLQAKIERLEQQRALEAERARLASVIEQGQNKLRQSQKMEAIGQLAGGVAHDFNNLLCVIRGNADLVLMSPGQLNEMATDCLKQITAASDRAANLTRQLMAFGRKQVMKTEPLNLTGVIGNLTKMLKRIIGEDIELKCTAAERLPFVQADVGMIEQVIVNLVVNARDAMPRGGQLVIATETFTFGHDYTRANPEARAGQFVCLSVSDTGTGIAPEDLPHIFEPFFTTKAPGKGTGLGLATAYGIVKQHQGWIEVISSVGLGSTFKVFLPAIELPLTVTPTAPSQTQPRGGKETILIVEDDDSVRSLTRRLLEGFGYRTLEASSGREALDKWGLRAREIDLLLTDMVMPEGVTGRELAQQMRTHRPGLKVLFISGYSPDVSGKDTGFIHQNHSRFLQKPIPPRELLETVRCCLDSN